jgi:hypothetical protein
LLEQAHRQEKKKNPKLHRDRIEKNAPE